jgi:hypothetical protein
MIQVLPKRCFSVRTKAISDTRQIHPEFFSDFIAPVCSRVRHEEPLECLASAPIPPYDIQQSMIDELHAIKNMIDIESVSQFVAQLIWMQNDDLLSELLLAIQKYNLAVQDVRNIIELV